MIGTALYWVVTVGAIFSVAVYALAFLLLPWEHKIPKWWSGK